MKLLVTTNCYPQGSFKGCQVFKRYVELVKPFVDEISVLAPYTLGIEWLHHFPYLKHYPEISESQLRSSVEDGINIIRFPTLPLVHSSLKPLKTAHAWSAIRSLLKKSSIDFDLIHAHFLDYSGEHAARISREFQKPYVLTVHDGKFDAHSPHYQQYQSIFKQAAGIQALNPREVAAFHRFKLQDKVAYIPNFIDTDVFQLGSKTMARKKLALPSAQKILLHVGSYLLNTKGQPDLLKMMTNLDADYHLYLLGEGREKQALKQLIQRYQLSNRVHLAGPFLPHRLKTWYQAADVFLFPSLRESFGIVQIEALACGLPVIAYQNGASEFILKNAPGVWIVPQGKWHYLTNLTKLIVNHTLPYNPPDLRTTVVKTYSTKVAQKKMMHFYQSVFESSSHK